MDIYFNWQEFVSAFVVLFAVIDITGSIPVIIDLRQKHRTINAEQTAIYSLTILIAFLFVGEALLGLFNVDISSFAVAGAIVIFIMGLEMLLGIEIFKNDSPIDTATLVPLVFPLIAGAGAFTALLSLRAEYNYLNIILAVVANMAVVYLIVKKVSWIERKIGLGGIYIMRKFFGIILLAISVKLMTSNLGLILSSFFNK
ncbi:MAG: MarC family protein [Candidatus Azobacteroides sp.]|nr:MarC family protein [Candidatus Azobacteroides sp.]